MPEGSGCTCFMLKVLSIASRMVELVYLSSEFLPSVVDVLLMTRLDEVFLGGQADLHWERW